MRNPRSADGFTLVELLIMVVILGVLGAIAYPSYTRSVAKGKRAEAKAQLLEAAQYMQRYYSQNDRYDQSNAATPVANALPTPLTTVPKNATGSAINYNLSFATNSLTTNGFTIQAVPANTMASDMCGTLSVNQVGRKSVSNTTNSQTADTCWK